MSHIPFHCPYQVKAYPTIFSPPRPVADLFQVRLKYSEDGDWQHFSLVHIPPSVQYAFEEGLVHGLHLETLDTNSAASGSIPGSPYFMVLGVELADGSRVTCVPPALHKVFKKKLIAAGAVLLIGSLMATTSAAWVGGLLFGLGTARIRAAFKIPRKPCWPVHPSQN